MAIAANAGQRSLLPGDRLRLAGPGCQSDPDGLGRVDIIPGLTGMMPTGDGLRGCCQLGMILLTCTDDTGVNKTIPLPGMAADKTNTRPPGVAGMFYPSGREEVGRLLDRLLREEKPVVDKSPVPGAVLGGIVPHAGMEYCGRQAVHFFEAALTNLFIAETVVIVNPNHYGLGPPISVDDHHYWEVSNGTAATDLEFAGEMKLPFSKAAQRREHSAEVIVPYIKHFFPGETRIVCLNMLDQDHDAAVEAAGRIHTAARKTGRRVLLIASSDFSHFVSRSEAYSKDDIILKAVLDKDSSGVYEKAVDHNLSVCGCGPIMALMEYSDIVEPDYKVRILSRGDSGSAGDTSSVVSYVSALFYI